MGTVRDLQQSPPDVECFKCDVTSAQSLLALQQELRDRRCSTGTCAVKAAGDAHA